MHAFASGSLNLESNFLQLFETSYLAQSILQVEYLAI